MSVIGPNVAGMGIRMPVGEFTVGVTESFRILWK